MRLRGFHAHIYFDATEVDAARAFAARAQERFGMPVGHFHLVPIGPHPRGSCQLSLRPAQFGEFATWAAEERGDLTIFAHGLSGDDKADHTHHVVWFGPSEELDLSLFD
ncbi:DOPA 4,5-dioxygenase family protein [Alteriqipengyuania flavescens]|uniref:DOPA 4,5-dioxygenase family protein n=1 Tax=Alteriqipengyuania flavescens TaxID=3053610 RepID=UPI0025B3651D|nr:DOPA 4,5-dioxygenase family protein [Alteriqipengyuania flavescens]WJY18045.1 DOPA 4,5-dioxygenase family protein [Alteriqipengyuania flavescens]WJY23987.1 DOPA 4,5-dioxygenase family protein [Alteriqipengyuania flavescens]